LFPLGEGYWDRLASDISFHVKVLHPLIDKAMEDEIDYYRNTIKDLKRTIRGYEIATKQYRSTTSFLCLSKFIKSTEFQTLTPD